MEKSQKFIDLVVWKKGHKLVLEIYKVSGQFPQNEIYGLTSQIRRAAVSITANIAEGYSRKGKNDKIRFYNISQSSLEELKYYLILAKDLEYYDTQHLQSDADEVGRLLYGYIQGLINKDI